jgi:hypothetical protein
VTSGPFGGALERGCQAHGVGNLAGHRLENLVVLPLERVAVLAWAERRQAGEFPPALQRQHDRGLAAQVVGMQTVRGPAAVVMLTTPHDASNPWSAPSNNQRIQGFATSNRVALRPRLITRRFVRSTI